MNCLISAKMLVVYFYPFFGVYFEGHSSRKCEAPIATEESEEAIPADMPKSCVALNCKSHNMKGEENVSFHLFPKNKERRSKWLKAMGRFNEDNTPWIPYKCAVLCGKHFIEGKGA